MIDVPVAESEVENVERNEIPEALLQRLFRRISEVSSLPAVASRIVQLANDPNTGADDLLGAIRGDPALAMRIMRTVNSSYYALDEKVANLKQGITLLGFNEVRNLALTAYVAPLFRESGQHGEYTRGGLWNHMVGVGMVARYIAGLVRTVPPQEAYLAGLLHDLGLVLIDQYLHRPFCRIIDLLTEKNRLCDLELQLLGFDHATLGQFVTEEWHLPEHLSVSIGSHHAPKEYSGPHRDIVYVVALANFFCHLKEVTSLGVRNVEMPSPDLFAELGIHKREVAAILDRVDEILQAADVMAVMYMR
jgi:HD-like signal output (HDOD) protein